MKKHILWIIITTVYCISGIGQIQQSITNSINGVNSGNNSISLTIPDFGGANWENGYVVENVINRVQLKIETLKNTAGVSFSAKVPITINYTKRNGQQATVSDQLFVNYNSTNGSSFQQIDLREYVDAYISNISFAPNTIVYSPGLSISDIQTIANALTLTSTTLFDKISVFDQAKVLTFSDFQVTPNTIDNSVEICWDVIDGALEYDLEWVWVESYDGLQYQIPNITSSRISFNSNASRITTKTNCYILPLTYERGVIAFRIRGRGINRNISEKPILGQWSCSSPSGTCANYDNIDPYQWYTNYPIPVAHEAEQLNWQVVTSYAEEGKRKDVITYYDGTMRDRQMATAINSDHNALIAETIYDHQGRKAIQTLPVPAWKDSALKFRNNFNQNTSGQPYSKLDFDFDPVLCGQPATSSMNDASGASYYYSPQFFNGLNTVQKQSHLATLPDAQGFPFIQTKYESDNTGRINSQGGAGPTYQLGNDHETKYGYGVPTQEEIDLLFGNNVGVANHYKKNMVVDPNAQASITYLDAKGNTIATALAGAAPPGMDQLDSYNPTTISVDLMDFNMEIVGSAVLEAAYNILVPNDANYQFFYSVDAEQFTDQCMPATKCYDCIYDLSIQIIDKSCGNIIYDNPRTIGSLYNADANGDLTVLDTICANNVQYATDATFNADLEVGSYTIIKRLTVNEAAADAYVDDYINDPNNSCTNVLEDFLQEELAKVDTTDCMIGCDDLVFDPNDTEREGWEEMTCDTLPESPCVIARRAMLADFFPGGQYALYDANFSASAYPLSILNANVTSLTGIPYYKSIVYPVSSYAQINGVATNPSTLNLQQYVTLYDEAWAELFLNSHPEICYLDRCLDIEDSHLFDIEIGEIDTYAEAEQAGYIDVLTGTGNLPNIDVYANHLNATQLSDFQDALIDLAANHTILELAIYTALCDDEANYTNLGNMSNLPPGSLATTPTCPTSALLNAASADELDLIWNNYRGLYLSIKNNFEYKLRSILAIQGGCYNECFDQDNFNPFINGFFAANMFPNCTNYIFPGGNVRQFFCLDQHCGVATFQLFKNKRKHFPSIYDAIGHMDLDYYNDPVGDVMRQLIDDLPEEVIDPCDSTGCLTIGLIDSAFNSLINQSTQIIGDSIDPTIMIQSEIVFDGIRYPVSLHRPADLDLDDRIYAQIGSCKIYWTDSLMRNSRKITGFFSGVCCIEVSPLFNGNNLIEFTLIQDDGQEFILQGITECDFDCAPPITERCGPLPMALDLQDLIQTFLNESLQGSGSQSSQFSIAYNLIGDHLLHQIDSINSNGILIVKGDWTRNELVLAISGRGCKISLDLSAVGITNAQTLILVQNIEPDYSAIDSDGYTQSFFIEVTTVDQRVYKVKGSWNCFNIGRCCTDDAPLPIPPRPIPPRPRPVPVPPVPGGGKLTKKQKRQIERELAKLEKKKNKKIIVVNPKIDWGPLVLHPTSPPKVYDPLCDDCLELQIEGGVFDGTPVSDCPSPYCADSISVVEMEGGINDECIESLYAVAEANALSRYEQYIDSISRDVKSRYMAKCLSAHEKFTGEMDYSLHHFTLYYYDQGNNLVQTVPPNGVETLDVQERQAMATYRQAVRDRKRNPTLPIPQKPVVNAIRNNWASEYTYNSLNQPVEQKIPDHGAMIAGSFVKQPSVFYYDHLGRIIASQNPEQKVSDEYSYTLYDGLGRIIESGGMTSSTGLLPGQQINTHVNAIGQYASQEWEDFLNGQKYEITQTTYDQPYYTGPPPAPIQGLIPGDNLRGRVAAVALYDTQTDLDNRKSSYTTHYSYDIHGNVQDLVQQPLGFARKYISYDYDLISGNVNAVFYQQGKADKFTHLYEYDADNRLIDVQTSRDGVIWDRDAAYAYYPHGPLARTVLGDEDVQGLDYAYTLQGWIKGMNSTALQEKTDIGQDGIMGHAHEFFAKDEVGFTLNYNGVDYSSIAPSNPATSFTSNFNAIDNRSGLYNGNIRSMTTAIGEFMKSDQKPAHYTYRYDQLNRIKSMNYHNNFNPTNNLWVSTTANSDYQTAYTYDGNGNIMTLNRNGLDDTGTPQAMDRFTYNYNNGNNQLGHVDDQPTLSANYTNDIDDQSPNNYTYDRIGNLIQDVSEGLNNIDWNLQGKISEIQKSSGPPIKFKYDALGNRVGKIYGDTTTYYVRDASGNVMSHYKRIVKRITSAFNQQIKLDQSAMIYGSSRIGMYDRPLYPIAAVVIGSNPSSRVKRRTLKRGAVQYELTNHLGNVLATVSDVKRLGKTVSGTSGWRADVKSANDYYPFGSELKKKLDDFNFGFNGQMKDNEIAGIGVSYTAIFWQYDSRSGHRWNSDPKPNPSQSIYSTFSNNPIVYTDPLGDTIRVSGSKRFVKRTNKALSRIQGTQEGSRMYNKLHSSSNVYTIRKYNKNTTKVASTSKLPNSWSVGDIGFRGAKYNKGGFFMGKGGWLSLGHELSHVEDVEDGSVSSKTWQTPDKTFNYPIVNYNPSTKSYSNAKKPGIGIVKPLGMDEVRAMDRENKMRAQSGIGLRTHYNTVFINSRTVDGVSIRLDYNTQQVVKGGIGTHPMYNTNYNLLKKK